MKRDIINFLTTVKAPNKGHSITGHLQIADKNQTTGRIYHEILKKKTFRKWSVIAKTFHQQT